MEADRYLAMSDNYYASVARHSLLCCINTPFLVVTEDYYSASCTTTHSEKLLILSELEIQRNTHITGNNLIPISIPIHFVNGSYMYTLYTGVFSSGV